MGVESWDAFPLLGLRFLLLLRWEMILKNLLGKEGSSDPLLSSRPFDTVEKILADGKTPPLSSRLSHGIPLLCFLSHLNTYTPSQKQSQLNSYGLYDFR